MRGEERIREVFSGNHNFKVEASLIHNDILKRCAFSRVVLNAAGSATFIISSLSTTSLSQRLVYFQVH